MNAYAGKESTTGRPSFSKSIVSRLKKKNEREEEPFTKNIVKTKMTIDAPGGRQQTKEEKSEPTDRHPWVPSIYVEEIIWPGGR